jgi:3-methyladenine DNA glycosylase AlkD
VAGTWPANTVAAARTVLVPLRDAERAESMAAYMKNVAPFLGIAAPDRRRALRTAWRNMPQPSSDELGSAALELAALPEREFHYAAYDLIDEFIDCTDEYFLDAYVTDLLVTTPWWDTVDGLVNAAVSPLCRSYDADWLIDEWSQSGDRWLVRAAIGHQRGWKSETNVDRVLGLCDRHWADSEFFVAKAIGWALRDLAWIDATAVQRFLDTHPATNRVAIREAERGLTARRRLPSNNDA